MKSTRTEKKEIKTRPDFNSRTMVPRNQEESDIASADAEYACGLMAGSPADAEYQWSHGSADVIDWDAHEAAARKAFDEWHKLGPQSAQY